MTHVPVEPVMPVANISMLTDVNVVQQGSPASFAQTLLHGLTAANDKMVNAERLVEAAAANESIPLHHVIYTLETARMDFELVMQIRGKMLDAYQQLVNMQI